MLYIIYIYIYIGYMQNPHYADYTVDAIQSIILSGEVMLKYLQKTKQKNNKNTKQLKITISTT